MGSCLGSVISTSVSPDSLGTRSGLFLNMAQPDSRITDKTTNNNNPLTILFFDFISTFSFKLKRRPMEFKVLYGFYILQNNAYNRQYFILLMLENQRKKIRRAWRCFITRRTKKYCNNLAL